ncbi:hypothetical protein M9H77_10009 [Catharanthus roseus]|uniref:Uncharacterized protein n=1 Tax=Catharanthus roseus TaxID=4058 RepID=A0ACC0C2E0_CATRO|nr:hypothetical protein M9H77_10009 [Catharanthus roseus]
MAETQIKRQREDDSHCEFVEDSKRHKSYDDILSILEEEGDEPNEDLSDIFTSLQQELSSDSAAADILPLLGSDGGSEVESGRQVTGGSIGAASECGSVRSDNELDEEDERVRVMRHLLEASDDELGIPNRVDEEINSGEGEQLFSLGDGMWEFEDDAANYYYSMMQSELFM